MAACPPPWPGPRACCGRRHDAVQVFKAWLAAATCDRDLSHAMQHFERVETLAVCLARAEPDFPAADLPVLRLAALAHDVLDHKYVSAAEAPRLLAEDARAVVVVVRGGEVLELVDAGVQGRDDGGVR